MTDRIRFLASLTLFAAAFSLSAQDVPPPEEPEAPEALFDQKIGDVGVVLQANGTWTTRFAAGWGSGFTPQGALPGLGYPGLQKGPVFTQEPDFALTLRLLERYYLEVAYHGTLDDRTFLLGYDGQPGEAVQWIKAGNASFSVPPRAGEALPDGRRGAPAAGAAFTLGPVALEAVARYEDGTRETKSFRGYRDVSTSTVGMGAWIRQRFFRLPGPYPLTGARVLVADPAGALGGYRDTNGSEAVINAATGEVRLPVSATKRYLVTWNGAGSWTNPATAVLHLTAATDSSPGSGTWFVLVQPGAPSAFELRDHYPVPAGTLGPILLIDKASGVPVSGHAVAQASTQDWFTVAGGEEAPFFSQNPGIYPTASAGTPPPSDAVLPWTFQLPVTTPSTSLNLGTDVLPSSLVVVRNGLATSAWKFDAGPGTLTFDGPVFETDAIEVSFQRKQTANKASDLVFWQGGHWDMSDGQNLEWNLQGRWNTDKTGFTTEDLQAPGRFAATVAYQGEAEEWSWSASVKGGALLADSTGHRHLYGQDTAGAQATLDGNSLRPSAAPGSIGGLTLTNANRAPSRFRDYWTTDPLTGTPQAGIWGTPGIALQPGGAGAWTGPYLVHGDGERADRLAVLEVDQSATTPTWSGMQVFLDSGKPRDLKATSAITVNVRVPAGLGTGRVFLQAGTLAEDFDGTHAVRTVEFRSYPALAFVDQTQGVKQYFPIPENSAWGNDGEGDGTAGGDGTLVARELTSSLSTSNPDWQSVRFVLTDAERQLLQRTTGWRLVFVPTAGSGQQTLLVGPVVFEGASWSVKADLTQSGTVNPVEQVDPANASGHELRVDWASARTAWTIEGRNSPVRPASYRTIAFRYQFPSGTPSTTTFTVALSEANGRGVTATWAPAALTSTWVDARINLRDKTLTLNGVPAGNVTFSGGATAWDRMTISMQGGSGSGTFYLSEVEAVDPVWEPMGNSTATTTWKQTQAWPSSAFPLVSGTTWSVTSAQSGLTADDWSWTGKTSLAGTFGPFRAQGEASVLRSASGQSGHGAYQATLPLGWTDGPSIELTDRFSDLGLRAEHVVVGVPWVGTWDAQVLAEGPPNTLDQEYKLGWMSPGQWPAGWGASLAGSLSQSRPWTGTLGDFGSQWVDSWSWLPFPQDPSPYALVGAEAATKSAWAPFFLETSAKGQVSQSVGSSIDWSPSGSWEVRTPLRFEGDQAWSLTPSVSKKVHAVFYETSAVFPDESARRAGSWLSGQPGGLLSPPFGEQFIAASPWTENGLQSGTVESDFGLDWDRSPVSDWTDLALPSNGGSKFTTTRGVDGSAEYSATQVSTHLQARGINLFGALGNTPVFSWYRTDVWTWSATGAWSTGTRDQDKNADASLATRADLVLTTEESVGLPLTYQGHWGTAPSQTVGVKPFWSLRQAAELPFELPRWLSPKAFRRQWVQELSSSLEFGWQPTPAPVLRNLQVSWKGRFLLSEKSELDLTTKWGQQWQNNLTVVGLEAALDLILAF